MRRLVLALLACLLAAPAHAQLGGGLMFPGPGTPHSAGGGGSASFSTPFADSQDLAFASTYTSPGFTLGSGNIIVFVNCHGRAGTITGVTINTHTATNIAGASDGNDNSAWYINGNVGGSGQTVVITNSLGVGHIAINGGTITSTSTTPSSASVLVEAGSATGPFSLSSIAVTIPTGGIGIGMMGTQSLTTGLPAGWSGGGAAAQTSMEAVNSTGNTGMITGAVSTTAGSFGPTVTPSPTGAWDFNAPAASLVSWGP